MTNASTSKSIVKSVASFVLPSDPIFKSPTKWYVLTGAPCSGKTTILEQLASRGFDCISEVPRRYIQQRLDNGETLAQIRSDEAALQRNLIQAKLQAEREAAPSKLTFFDRAMPDSISYYRVAGLDPQQVVADCFEFRYAGVFLLDRLPLVTDSVRNEAEDTVAFLDHWLEHDYRALGYPVTRVPILPVDQRIAFILSALDLS